MYRGRNGGFFNKGQLLISDGDYDSSESLDNGLILVSKDNRYGCITLLMAC